ncbi:MAG TPA: GNAT family acetyltransferase [Candidatus Methylacidiphilales bacterium]|jgi:ribosomal protein S18 acetylase RimI-like enzyme|nr:GNAT family acetyltransferase [Candidatus Methylacidiphilales bacterium]
MSSHLHIRPYHTHDETAVIDLWRTCNLLVPHNNPLKDIRRKLRVNPEWFLIGEQDSLIVATCMAGYEGHRGWINYLAVSPGAQRRGIASRMMEEAEILLRKAGCPKINVQIRSTNLQVIEFYKSIGFKVDEVASMGKRLEVDEGV